MGPQVREPGGRSAAEVAVACSSCIATDERAVSDRPFSSAPRRESPGRRAVIYGLYRFEERHWGRMEEALARTVEREAERHAFSLPSVRPSARQVIHSGYMAR
jgi:hypothetical protein